MNMEKNVQQCVPKQFSDATMSTISTISNSISCRICQDSLITEHLISPCLCTGTTGSLHPSCLKKWLRQSARNCCEICKFEFKTVMISKSFREVGEI